LVALLGGGNQTWVTPSSASRGTSLSKCFHQLISGSAQSHVKNWIFEGQPGQVSVYILQENCLTIRGFLEFLSGPRDIHVKAPGVSWPICSNVRSHESIFEVDGLACSVCKLSPIWLVFKLRRRLPIYFLNLSEPCLSLIRYRYVH